MSAAPKLPDRISDVEGMKRGLVFDLVVGGLFAAFFVLSAFGF